MKAGMLLVAYFYMLCVALPSCADSIEILTFAYPPYMHEDGTGIMEELITQAATESGSRVRFMVLPIKRAILMFRKEATRHQLFLGESRYFSDSEALNLRIKKLLFARLVLVYNKKKSLRDVTFLPEQLKGKTVAVSIGNEYSSRKLLGMEMNLEFARLENNIKRLKSGRVDFWHTLDITALAFIDEYFPGQREEFGIWAYQNPIPIELIAKENTEVEEGFQKIVKGFNTLVANGKYQKILEAYYGKGQVPQSVKAE